MGLSNYGIGICELLLIRTCSGRLRMLNHARAVKAVDALRGSCSSRMRHAKAAKGPITWFEKKMRSWKGLKKGEAKQSHDSTLARHLHLITM